MEAYGLVDADDAVASYDTYRAVITMCVDVPSDYVAQMKQPIRRHTRCAKVVLSHEFALLTMIDCRLAAGRRAETYPLDRKR